MAGLSHFISPMAMGTVDVALWDIAGKAAGMPIHRLLGTCRDRIPVYFSSGHHETSEGYAKVGALLGMSRAGRDTTPPSAARAMAGSPVEANRLCIEACAEDGSSVGTDMTLMLDPSWDYDYPQALQVGQAIQDLGYYWYEKPLPAQDIHGYQRLKAAAAYSLSLPPKSRRVA